METEEINEMVQGSPGVLNNVRGGPGRFITQDKSIEPIDITRIQHFNLIPDYRETTTSFHPIVVKSGEAIHCIEGWDKIEYARSNASTIIPCECYHIENFSMTELAIRKVSIRIVPEGGSCRYIPRLIDICAKGKYLLSSQPTTGVDIP